MHQKFEKSLAEQFSLEVIHAVAIRCQLGLQTSDDLTGLDFQDGSLIRLRVDAGCQLQAQLGCRSECLHVGSPAWQSQDTWPSYMLPVSPRANIPKEPGKRLFWSSFASYAALLLLHSIGYKEVISHPRLEGWRHRNYLLKRGVANNLQICLKTVRQHIKFSRIKYKRQNLELNVYCHWSNTQGTRIWKTSERNAKIIVTVLLLWMIFLHLFYNRKERWKERKQHIPHRSKWFRVFAS